MHSVAIIIPTIGTEYLKEAVLSALNQDYPCRCIVAVDGSLYDVPVNQILQEIDADKVEVLRIPFNSGKDGKVCHPKLSAIPFLLDTDYVAFLDEDNIYEKDHISSIMDFILQELKKGKDPAMIHSLRSIIDKDGNFICNDNFESIGPFCDTSTMLVKRDIACRYAYLWILEWNVHKVGNTTIRPNDRLFSLTLYEKEYCIPNRRYTLKYRTYEGKSNSPQFFKTNSMQHIVEPWMKLTLYIAHFSPVVCNQAISRPCNADMWKDQWQFSIVDALRRYYNVKNAYLEAIPAGATVLFVCCFPEMLPERIYKRTDIRKILICMESPNVRHTRNFEKSFLDNFTDIVTYNKFNIQDPAQKWHHVIHPINVDFLYGHLNLINRIQNTDQNRKICCVLGNRPFKGEYEILGTKLQSLDYLRYEYAKHLKIDCYGHGWLSESGITAKGFDPRHPIDIQQNYSFSLITENQTNPGEFGVTEKVYHAIIAGCIPLYYHPYDSISHIPDECWINISKIQPEELQQYLDSVDVEQYKQNIYKYRESILAAVSANKYGEELYKIIQ